MKSSLNDTSKKYLQPEVKINDNILSFNGVAVQISNISKIWLGEIEKSMWWLIFGIILSSAFGLCILLIICFFMKNKRTLNIELNSGYVFIMTSKQDSFYEEAFCTLSECFIERKNNTTTTINFGTGTVIHGSVVNRGYNKVEENNVHINYDTLDNDLTKVRDILLTNHCNAEDIEYIDGILKAIKIKIML